MTDPRLTGRQLTLAAKQGQALLITNTAGTQVTQKVRDHGWAHVIEGTPTAGIR